MHDSCLRFPASLILTRDGITHGRVAEALGASASAVSTQSAAIRRLQRALVPVLGAGPEVASEVAAASHQGGEQR